MQLRHPKHNLTPASDAFVGRSRSVRRLARLFDSGAKVVSVVGPEGIGKSRVALRYISHSLNDWIKAGNSGAFIVDLSDVGGPMELIRALQNALEFDVQKAAADGGDDDAMAQLVPYLAQREPGLLLLDDIDGCRDDVRRVVELLQKAEAPLCVLCTGADRLGVVDEAVVQLGGLPLPKRKVSKEEVLQSEAVRLFIERSKEVSRGYQPGAKDLSAISAVVRHLEGNPLAIELAAARMRTLSPQELLERLPRSVKELQKQSKKKSERSNTSRQTVEWSWSMLSPREQRALEMSSVFRGGFDEEAAEAVIHFEQDDAPADVLDVLQDLVDKNLLKASVVEEEGLSIRFHHYTPIREYAEQARQQRKDDDPLRRHTAHYLERGEDLRSKVDGPAGFSARRALERDADNLLAVVQRELEQDEQNAHTLQAALRGVLVLEPLLTTRGPFPLYIELLDRVLAAAGACGVDAQFLAQGHEARGRAHRTQGQNKLARDDMQRAAQYAEEVDSPLLMGRALANLGTLDVDDGEYLEAHGHYDTAVTLLRKAGAELVLARTIMFSALLAAKEGHTDEAQAGLQRALDACKEHGDRRYEGIAQWHLGALLVRRGEVDDGRRLLRRAMQVHRTLKNLRYEYETVMALARLDLAHGRAANARSSLERALVIAERGLDPVPQARASLLLSDVAVKQNLLDEAAAWSRTARRSAKSVDHREWLAWSTLRVATLAVAQKPSRASKAEATLQALLEEDGRWVQHFIPVAEMALAWLRNEDKSPPLDVMHDAVRDGVRFVQSLPTPTCTS